MKKIVCSLSGITLLFFLLTVQVGFSSCQKEELVHDTTVLIVHDTTEFTVHDTLVLGKECPPPIYPITGIWVGSYTADLLPNVPPQYYSFIIKPGGKLTVESHPNDSTIYATGTWNLKNNILSCEFIYQQSLEGYPVKQTATAVYDS